MSGTFNTTRLSGARVLVTGDGEQSCVLNSRGFDELKLSFAHEDIEKDFQEEVEEFFAPLVEAGERAEEAHKAAHVQYDDGMTLVIEEPIETIMGTPGRSLTMDHDTAVLFYIEQNDTDRLIWVGNDSIELLAVTV